MRAPIIFLVTAFGVVLWVGLDAFALPGGALPGGALWGVALPVVAVSAWLARPAPLGASIGIIGAAGILWGTAVARQHAATCEGRWKAGEGRTRAAIIQLLDPVPDSGAVADADVVPGPCGGALRLRW